MERILNTGGVVVQGYFAIISLLLIIIMVIICAKQLGIKGIKIFKFGELDKKDFFIFHFALLFFYLIFSSVFDWPKLGNKESNRVKRKGLVY